jgi:hypothetical protein
MWQQDLVYVLIKMAVVLKQSGRPEEALEHAEDSLGICERLRLVNPDNVFWRQDERLSRSMVARLCTVVNRRRKREARMVECAPVQSPAQ